MSDIQYKMLKLHLEHLEAKLKWALERIQELELDKCRKKA